LQWTLGHLHVAKGPLPRPGGDCYGAALHEYIDLFGRHGIVHDLIYYRGAKRYYSVVVVFGPRGARGKGT